MKKLLKTVQEYNDRMAAIQTGTDVEVQEILSHAETLPTEEKQKILFFVGQLTVWAGLSAQARAKQLESCQTLVDKLPVKRSATKKAKDNA